MKTSSRPQQNTSREGRWRARPIVAAAVRVAVLVAPVAASLTVTTAARLLVSPPAPAIARAGWWAGMLGVAVLVAVAVERLGRRVMPLATLLRMAMLFPDRAPSRFEVARRAGSVRELRKLAEEVQTEGAHERSAGQAAATILALVTALSAHDRRTRGHAERVRIFTDMLAEELHLSHDDQYRLRWSALLHDIGKLMVHARILNKPGKLDDREWDMVRAHPVEGARIAEPLMVWLGPWGRTIAEHHERYDGTGYPFGRAGDAISVGARIASVADAYDTMTAARSYKRPMATRAAREELARCAGTQFDPAMVRAFLSISVPRLVWVSGPVSFLVHLPYLWRLQEAGQQVLGAVAQVAAAGAVVTVAAVAVTGPTAVPAGPSHGGLRPAQAATASFVTGAPSPMPRFGDGNRGERGGSGTSGGGEGGTDPSPSPSPEPSESPSGSRGGGIQLQLPLPLPTQLPLLLPTPLPLPPNLSLPVPIPTSLPLPTQLPLPHLSPSRSG